MTEGAPDAARGPGRRWVAYVLVLAAALAGAALALTRGGGNTGAVTTTTAPGSTATLPTTLPGFTKIGPVVSAVVPVFPGAGGLVPKFPRTSDGCSQRIFTVQWQTQGGAPVTAGMTHGVAPNAALDTIPLPATAAAGVMRGDGCSQPEFLFVKHPPVILENVAVSYQVWAVAP